MHFKSNNIKHLKYIKKLDELNALRNNKLFLIEEYTKAHDKLLFECNKHHILNIIAYSVSNGTGCSICSGKHKKTTDDFIKYLNENTNWTLIKGEKYISSKHKIKVKCKNNHIRELTPTVIIHQKIGCAICSKKIKKTTDGFIKDLIKKK